MFIISFQYRETSMTRFDFFVIIFVSNFIQFPMLNILSSHRSIRKYTDRPVDRALIENLLETAIQGSSNTGNMQTYSVVVTTGEELKKTLSPAHFGQPMVVQAPVVITFCADFHRFSLWCEQREAQPGYDNFESFISAAVDTVVLAQSFALAAESQGLGICYLGTTTYNAAEIIEALQLPPLVVPVTTLTVGYPAEDPALTDRLPLSAVIHHEKYEDYTKEKIERLYEQKENSDFYRKFVAENNKKTLAQVFTDVRYTREANEFFSKKFLDVLRKQGFLK